MGYLGDNVVISGDIVCSHPENIYVYNNSHIFGPFTYIGNDGKFILKENSGVAQGLTVITNRHKRTIGELLFGGKKWEGRSKDADVIIEEDVWIGANVTISGGCTIGRGVTIGAGAVVRSSIPPYAIVLGNPAKIVGFNYRPDGMLEHEMNLYEDDKKTDYNMYVSNYKKYFESRIREISSFLSLKA